MCPDTLSLLSYLAENGVKVRNYSTGAIECPNGRSAFASKVISKNGEDKYKLMHQRSSGTYYQTATTREGLLKRIRENKY